MTGPPARAPKPPRRAVGSGRVLMWRGGSLWVGRDTGVAKAHRHHALQITLAPDRPVRLRGTDGDEWMSTRAAIVMPDRTHQFDGGGGDVVMVFVEPETTAGRRLVARYGASAVTALVDDALFVESSRLLDRMGQGADDEALVAGAKAIVARLVGEVPDAQTVDPRITRSLEWIRTHLETPVTLAQAAAVAHLSPGRFRHLFVAQTGISFRAYVLWARVNAAMVTAMAGRSWTAAAQDAGFADSAHFTRTCQRMFGIAPTMLERESAAPRA